MADGKTEPKPAIDSSALNSRQLKFAESVLSGMTSKDAYIKAGYESTSDGALIACASRLLSNAKVRAYVEERQYQKAMDSGLTIETWIEWNIAEAKGRVKGQKCSPASRSSALDRLGRYLGIFQADKAQDLAKEPTESLEKQLPAALDIIRSGRKVQKAS